MKNGYRRVEVSYDGYDLDTEATDPEIERDRLVNALRGFFNIKGFTADWNVIERCESERLVTTLSMICPLGFADKQALLEATSTTDRAMKLSTLLEMEISGHELNGDGDNNVFH